MNAIDAAIQLADKYFWLFLVVLSRIGPMVLFMPVLGETVLPLRFRVVVCVVVSSLIMPLLDLHIPKINVFIFLQVSLLEVIVGAWLGVTLRLMFTAMQMAGVLVSQFLSISQMLGANQADESFLIFGRFYHWIAIGYACVVGIPVGIVRYATESYLHFPIGVKFELDSLLPLIVECFAFSFSVGFGLAGSFFIFTILYNVTSGFIGKAMPQLMVSIAALPAALLVGLLLFILTIVFSIETFSVRIFEILGWGFI